MEKLARLSADFKGVQFNVPCDFDVADDVHVFTVGEPHLVAIRKFYFKNISDQFHLDLHKKKQFCRTYIYIYKQLKHSLHSFWRIPNLGIGSPQQGILYFPFLFTPTPCCFWVADDHGSISVIVEPWIEVHGDMIFVTPQVDLESERIRLTPQMNWWLAELKSPLNLAARISSMMEGMQKCLDGSPFSIVQNKQLHFELISSSQTCILQL